MKCPKCKRGTLTPIATVIGGPDPHTTYQCSRWKSCGYIGRVS